MGLDAAAVAHDVGKLLHVPAGLAAVSVPVAAWAGDTHAIVPLTVAALVTAGLGGFLSWRYERARAAHRWPAVEVVALGWLAAGLVAASVLVALGAGAPAGTADVAFRDPLNALFEGMSGITSTGLTVIPGQEAELTTIAQWWRSLLQWVGGVGMVVFALGFGRTATGMRVLYEAEGRHPDLPGGVGGTVRRTVAVYVGLTVVSIGALALTDHDGWAALNHGMSGIATGGFNVTGDSLAGYGTSTRIVTVGVLLLGSATFVGHYLLLVRRDVAGWWRLTPVRAHVLVMALGAGALVGLNAATGAAVPVVDGAFQWVSAAGTAGFQTDLELSGWTAPALAAMTVAMFVGVPSGSTGGGLKLDRAVWIVKEALRELRGDDARIRWDGASVSDERRRSVVGDTTALAGLWFVTGVVGVAAVAAATDAPLGSVVFDVVSAQSNAGLDVGLVGQDLAGSAKVALVALMYLGRLELLVAMVFATQRERA